jgi:hypothetical protein
VAREPRYRDGGILLLVAAAIGAVLGADTALRAIDALPEAKETLAWSAALFLGAAICGGLGLRMLQRAKGK